MVQNGNSMKWKQYKMEIYVYNVSILYILGIDLVGPLKECNGNKYIATAVCYFMKFVEAKLIPDKTGEQVALFIYELMSRYGIFETALSDQGGWYMIKYIVTVRIQAVVLNENRNACIYIIENKYYFLHRD